MTLSLLTRSTARFSPCRTWRYTLTRTWDIVKPAMCVIGLNPSTADETRDDATIRRCIGFAKRESFGGLVMTNLFGFRSTAPEGLLTVDDPIGPENLAAIRAASADAAIVVAAWGSHKKLGILVQAQATAVRAMLRKEGVALRCFGVNGDGQPRHPLYLANETPIVLLSQARLA